MHDQSRQKKGHRWFWAAFVIIVPLLAAAFGVYSGFQYVNRPTPEKTLSVFCIAVQSGDETTAFAQFTNAYQHAYPSQQFKSDITIDKVTSCSFGTVKLTGKRAVTRMTLVHTSGVTNSDMISLGMDGGSGNEWLIESGLHLSTPLQTMTTFCDAVRNGDYNAAHNQFTDGYQHEYPEQQFASDMSQDKVISCSHAAFVVSGTSASSVLTLIHTSKMVNTDVISLSQDGNEIWKIANGIHLSTPLETLNTFCNALQSGNYQMAYMQLSQDFQKTVSEQEFVSAFTQNAVTSCSHNTLTLSGNSATSTVKLASALIPAYSELVLLVPDSSSNWKIVDMRM
jgi:limonene-1,2-epoxide hydrolase